MYVASFKQPPGTLGFSSSTEYDRHVSTNHAYPSTCLIPRHGSVILSPDFSLHQPRGTIMAKRSVQPNFCFHFYRRKYLTSTQTRWKGVEWMRMRSLMTQAPRFCGVYMLWSNNLGQSVLVPYQLSASSYATGKMIIAHYRPLYIGSLDAVH